MKHTLKLCAVVVAVLFTTACATDDVDGEFDPSSEGSDITTGSTGTVGDGTESDSILAPAGNEGGAVVVEPDQFQQPSPLNTRPSGTATTQPAVNDHNQQAMPDTHDPSDETEAETTGTNEMGAADEPSHNPVRGSTTGNNAP